MQHPRSSVAQQSRSPAEIQPLFVLQQERDLLRLERDLLRRELDAAQMREQAALEGGIKEKSLTMPAAKA
jgi:hypothetical protein